MAVIKLPLPVQTAFADLVQRCLDAAFDDKRGEPGRFVKRSRGGLDYWYFDAPEKGEDGKVKWRSRYIGPVADVDLTARVEQFSGIRASAMERRKIVASLRGAGLPVPVGLVGDIVDALGRKGLFTLRGVLVGTMAFQTYAGLLGVRLPGAVVATSDADFAQFHSVSVAVEDSIPPILDILRGVDPSFGPVPSIKAKGQASAFANATGFKVEFLTPNRGSDEHQGKLTPMPALGGASAEPLRYLDFLLYNPVRSVLLHNTGVLVNVPAPERYAVHKLIVTTRRRHDPEGLAKASKDAAQAGTLLEAMAAERRLADVGAVWMEAWQRGSKWRETLETGRLRLSENQTRLLRQAVLQACREERLDPAEFGYAGGAEAERTSPSP